MKIPLNFLTNVSNVLSPMMSTTKATTSLHDLIAPASIELDFKYIHIGSKYYRTFFAIGYPRYVSANWLQPLIDFDSTLDISMFVYPVLVDDILSNLKRKIAEMEATISVEEKSGKAPNPKVTAALTDAFSLQDELAKGTERFFQFSLYITVSSDTLEDLDEMSKQIVSTLASMLLVVKTATLQMEDGFKSTLPMGHDRLGIIRNMDTSSLASTFPFTSATLTQDKGIMYGVNQENGSLIIFDRFSMENANEVVFGKSGSGKSYYIKLQTMREFMFGSEIIIIDPENEYELLAKTLNGSHVMFSPSSPIKINPFDLSGMYEEGENELGVKIVSLHSLIKIMVGQLEPVMDAVLDRAIVNTYAQKGITQDPTTQTKEPPIMEDLYNMLLGMPEPEAQGLAMRIERFVKGSLSGLFNQQSNFAINNPLTVFSIRNLEDELRAISMHIILDFVWTRVRSSLKRRILIVDEAWYLMRYEDSASFIFSIAKRARKYYLGLITATQDVEDFLKGQYGKPVLTNSSMQLLLKQSPSEVDSVAETFFLSEGEKQMLLSAGVGQGIFFAGTNHVAMQIVSAPFEDAIITSKPEEVKARQDKAHQKEAEKQAEALAKPTIATQTVPVQETKQILQ